MQTCLEKKGIETRNEVLVRNDYNRTDEYSEKHSDALSDGDILGKGTGRGGHTHSIPDCNKPSAINYSTFDTNNGGGKYDIEGRNGKGGRLFLENISKYNKNNEYGAHLVDTSANLADGQILI
jgi:hypothetical protein